MHTFRINEVNFETPSGTGRVMRSVGKSHACARFMSDLRTTCVFFNLTGLGLLGSACEYANLLHLFEAMHELVRLPIAGSKSLAIVAFLEMVTHISHT